MTVSSLHNEAMDIAERAFSEKRADSGKAIDLFIQASIIEKKAALLAKEQKASEKTVAILLRSAASLAFNAGNYTEVKSLVELALSGNPPADIKAELDLLLENINSNSTRKYVSPSEIDDNYESLVHENDVKYNPASEEKKLSLAQLGDDELIIEIKKGNKDLFKILFERYFTSLVFYVNKIINDKQNAEEIATTVFVKLWSRIENFDSINQIKRYLFISARNASLDSLRIKKRLLKTNDEYLQLLEEGDESEIQNSIPDIELLTAINTAIDKLPVKASSVFSLMYIEGLSTQEVSKKLNISEFIVRSLKIRAIQLIREYLKNLDH